MIAPPAELVLPWQQSQWERLWAAHRSQRLPQALLITGIPGVGKGHFSRALAASLLCSNPGGDGRPCSQCRGCYLLAAGTHPDYRRLQPAEPGKVIKVDMIREFTRGENLTARAGGYKLVIIEPADTMNPAAANSLLKTLEEPVPWTLMLLVTSAPGQLPATIRSRCQKLHIGAPARTLASHWLRGQGVEEDTDLLLSLAAGAPLKALDLASKETLASRIKLLDEFAAILAQREDPVTVAARWSKLDLARLLDWYSGWLIDCLRLKADSEARELINPDQRKRLQAIGNRIEFHELYRLLDKAYAIIRGLGTPLNPQLTLEGVLLPLSASISGERKRVRK